MKTILLLVIAAAITTSLPAQMYTLNWGSSFTPAWADMATSGTAYNIGGSGINCTVSTSRSGGIFTNVYGTYGGPATPTVNSSTFVVPGSTHNLQLSLEYSNPSQYTDITFTFSAIVYNLTFYIADIDRLTNTTNSYYDRVRVTGSTGLSAVNPVLTKYDPTTDPNFLIISGNTARVNTNSGMAGNTLTNATDQKGTIKVDFRNRAIVSFTIRYDNAPGVMSDPGVQNIGFGNIYFLRIPALPVELNSFTGEEKQGKNHLTWTSTNETDMQYYAIEHSDNGKEFKEIGKMNAVNTSSENTYNFIDAAVRGTSYYRLKMVDIDGSFTYSRIIRIDVDPTTDLAVFPTVFHSSFSIELQSRKEQNLGWELKDLQGRTIHRSILNTKKGMNRFFIQLPFTLSSGQYFVCVEGRASVRVMSM